MDIFEFVTTCCFVAAGLCGSPTRIRWIRDEYRL